MKTGSRSNSVVEKAVKLVTGTACMFSNFSFVNSKQNAN